MSKRTFKGKVVKAGKEDKTIKVTVLKTFLHPKYGKRIAMHKKYTAHDPENKCSIGDQVTIIENRPISKTKKWLVIY